MKPHLWQRASAFAARSHEHQYRADGETPYFSHCARVVTVLTTVFGCTDERAIAAAFLHDTIEDTPCDYDRIEKEFGPEVAACVSALTKNHLLQEAARERDYDRRLREASWRARLVKLADVYDNCLDARTPAKRRKMRLRSRRAMEIARGDARRRPETARAIAAVARVIRSMS